LDSHFISDWANRVPRTQNEIKEEEGSQ